MLNTSVHDFHAFGEVVAKMKDTAAVAVLGSPDALEESGVVKKTRKVL